MLLNPCAVPSTWGGWWGEGDEKVFVDDDAFPSTFGTGSEDYFNYAWSSADIFWHAYCGQPRNDGPGNRGFVTNYRWHIADALPFERRLAFYMELLPHERTPGMSYARIAYHYARPGLMDDHLAITGGDVRPLELPPNWQPAARFACQGTVFHPAENLVDPEASISSASAPLWAGGRLLIWEPTAAGAELSFRVPVADDGPHVLHLALALDRRAGALSVKLDGKPTGFGGAGGIIDLHTPHRVLLRQYESAKLPLAKGSHTLTIRCEKLSPADGRTVFGIDYVGVQAR
jgi:hypothetical protein